MVLPLCEHVQTHHLLHAVVFLAGWVVPLDNGRENTDIAVTFKLYLSHVESDDLSFLCALHSLTLG